MVNNKTKVGSFEAICIITITIVNKIFFTSASITVDRAGTAAWYMTIISSLTAMFFFYLSYLLIRRFPGKNIIEISELVLGKFLGKIVILLLSAFTLFYTTSALREFVEMIKVYNLPRTPISFIIITFLLVVVVVNLRGLESIARSATICFFIVIAGLISLLLLAIPLYEPKFVYPILGYGIDRTLMNGFLRSSAYSEVIFLAFFANTFTNSKEYRKIGITSLIFSGIFISVSILCYIMSFCYSHCSHYLSGLFELSKSIYYNRFIQRVESIFLFIWVLSSLITVSTSYFVSIFSYTRVFRIKNVKSIIIPFTIFLYTVCLMPRNIVEIIEINLRITREFSLILYFGIPLLILIVSLILNKKGDDFRNVKKNTIASNDN